MLPKLWNEYNPGSLRLAQIVANQDITENKFNKYVNRADLCPHTTVQR